MQFLKKKILNIIIIYILFISNSFTQKTVKLTENWFFKKAGDIAWLPAQVPGNIYRDLRMNQLIQDPFYGNNEKELQWVGQQEWWWKCHFEWDGSSEFSNIDINFESLDTYAELFLNLKKIGEHNNYFSPFSMPISQWLHIGQNELLVKIKPAALISDSLYATKSVKLPGEMRVMTRKPQFHYGWDFGPKFIGAGIPGNVALKFWNHLNIEHATLQTKTIHKDFAELELILDFSSVTNQKITLDLFVDQHRFTWVESITTKSIQLRKDIRIPKAKLWWPNGSGNSHLYNSKLTILNEVNEPITERHWKTGVRTIELIHKKDSWGKSFYFNINGQNIYIKGANYIPQDIFQTVNQDHLAILMDAKECNYNMLRVWGGGRYESDSFYELCDQLGILVWQDFMFACGMYPGDEIFLQNVQHEAQEQVKRLSRFSCMALWCGNNENNEGWHRWGWQSLLDLNEKNKLWADYQKLFNQILPAVVKKYSNNTSYWESSPLHGRGDAQFQFEGDAHDWGVWHDEMPFERFETHVPRFMSEAGFQSLPSITTIEAFAPKKEWDLESASMLSHQKHPRGNKLIKDYINLDFPEPGNFEDLIYLNQLAQAEGLCKGIKAQRRHKPICMGTLYWQYNDCWPGISWSSRDYFGRWKALQHYSKEWYENVIITWRDSSNIIDCFMTSDILNPIQRNVKLYLMDFYGKIIWRDSFQCKLQTNQSKRIYTLNTKILNVEINSATNFIFATWDENGTERKSIHYFEKMKNLELPKVTFYIERGMNTDEGVLIQIKSTALAKSVYLLEDSTHRFFPNFFDLIPGESKTILCKTNDIDFDEKLIKIKYLNSLVQKQP
ncbi:MAG: glycoside hydrolase family 2 protein [Bacteroidota bacterium]|nr:glycoside hydrolase family 2 protein [Bacteroidota bacterium]